MIKPPESSAKIVLIYGILGGACSILLWFGIEHLGDAWATPRRILFGLPFLIVGMLASTQTGRVHTGMLAGLVAGLTTGIIFYVTYVLGTSASFSLGSLLFVMLPLAGGAVFGKVGGVAGIWRYLRKS